MHTPIRMIMEAEWDDFKHNRSLGDTLQSRYDGIWEVAKRLREYFITHERQPW